MTCRYESLNCIYNIEIYDMQICYTEFHIYIIYIYNIDTYDMQICFTQLHILLRVSEANEVPTSSHICVSLSTLNWL